MTFTKEERKKLGQMRDHLALLGIAMKLTTAI
jgi:hypothetical protein